MQVTVLGSGAANPSPRRASAGYLVEWRGGALLLDAAAGTYMRALAAGLEPDDLRAVLLTHFHPDHTADLAGLFWARRQAKVQAPLILAGPPGTAELVERFHRLYDYEGWVPPLRLEGYPLRIEGLRAEAFEARHSPEAVCLRLIEGEKVLAYSGDTGDCEGLRAACHGADLALLECTSADPKEGHMTPADCEAVVAAARPENVLLTHLAEEAPTSLPQAEDGLVISI